MDLNEILGRALMVADEAEVLHVVSRETPAIFETNRLKLLETREVVGLALRIIKNGRIGFASTTDLSNLQGLVDAAMEVAPFGAEARFEFPSKSVYPSVEVYDAGVETITENEMVSLGQDLIDNVLADHPDVQWDGHVGKAITTQSIVNSRGGAVSYTSSNFGVSLHGTLVQGEDMLFVGDMESSCRPVTDTSAIRESVATQLARARVTASPVSGSLPVIFTPHGVAGTLLGPLLSGINGRTVLQGTSPLIDRLGERIVSETFSLWDDPTLQYIPGSSKADDEGVPSRRQVLIDKGVVTTFLYDLQTAGQAGTETTGSASRSLSTLPLPSSSVLIIDGGSVTFDEMVKDIQEGIVVEQLLGAGQGNVLAGEFNANVLLGYLVKNGDLVGRIKDTTISGNVYDVLNNLVAIGNETRWLGGHLNTPALYCKSVSVSAKK